MEYQTRETLKTTDLNSTQLRTETGAVCETWSLDAFMVAVGYEENFSSNYVDMTGINNTI
jgi:hypothetical protein